MLAGLTQAFEEEGGGGEWGGGRMERAWEPSESGQGWPGRGRRAGRVPESVWSLRPDSLPCQDTPKGVEETVPEPGYQIFGSAEREDG